MKKYFYSSLIALGVFLLTLTYVTCIHRVKGFCYKKIHSLYGYESRWDFGPPNGEQEALLDRIAAQPFYLLGSGKECYAFVSEDGEIVVKFFKQKHMRTQYLLNYLPLSPELRMIRNETLNRHSHRRKLLFQSYQLAYERLQDYSGVLFLHLTKTDYLKRAMTIVTPKKKKILLKLDDMEFLVQRRAFPIFHQIEGEETVDAILNYLSVRNERGIGDKDINCERNLGMLNGKVFQVDIGELYPTLPRKVAKEELITATLDLKAYLERKHQKLADYLDDAIEKH